MELKDFTNIMQSTSMKIRKYSPDFTNPVVTRAWFEELGHLDAQQLWQTAKKAVALLDEFPSIKWFLEMSKGRVALSDDERGQEIASRIEESISRYGYTNGSMAEKYIGQIGWEVVNTMGGWSRICEVTTNEMLPSSRKQWRDTAIVVSKRLHAEGKNTGPALPVGSRVDKPDVLRIALEGITISSMPQDKAPTTFASMANFLRENQ